MKIPLSLLKTYLPIENTPLSEISDALVSLGIEVDAIEGSELLFSSVIAAKVLKIEPHPAKKTLQILHLTDKTKTYTVCCSDLSIQIQEILAFAKPGSTVQGKTVKKAPLHRVESEGMLVSGKELGVSEESDSVLRLDDTFILGSDIQTALHDPVFVLSLTPNLGHCQSVLGIARELSAYFSIKIEKKTPTSSTLPSKVSIENSEDCPQYHYAVLENLPKTPSPFWLRFALEKAGFSSSFLAVDVLNYVLIMTGQPMHAFDAKKVSEDLQVRRSSKEESLEFLDGKTRKIPKGSLGIYQKDTLIALAGIMGSLDSSIQESSSSFLLESAEFHPTLLRKTAGAIGLRTESFQRFEKGVDPKGAVFALQMAIDLLQEITKKKEKISIYSKERAFQKKSILFREDKLSKILGKKISKNEIENLLQRLECTLSRAKEQNGWRVEPPSYRNDLKEEIDLIEEVARLYGYNHLIQANTFSNAQAHDPFYLFLSKVRKNCLALSLNECITPDLISESLAEKVLELSLQKKDLLKTLYAKSDDHSILRSSILPSLLQVLAKNLQQFSQGMQGFELGKVYFQTEKGPQENPVLAILLSGPSTPQFWGEKPQEQDFYFLKGLLETLFEQPFTISPSKHPSLHPTRQGDILFQGKDIGVLGNIHPHLLESFSIKQTALFLEIQLTPLYLSEKIGKKIQPFSSFPSSTRDWTLSLSEDFPYAKLEAFLSSLHSPILEEFFLLDLFVKPSLKKKNLTLRFTYRSKERTLLFEEIEKEQQSLQTAVEGFLQKEGILL